MTLRSPSRASHREAPAMRPCYAPIIANDMSVLGTRCLAKRCAGSAR